MFQIDGSATDISISCVWYRTYLMHVMGEIGLLKRPPAPAHAFAVLIAIQVLSPLDLRHHSPSQGSEVKCSLANLHLAVGF